MPEDVESTRLPLEDLTDTLRRMERRLEALESWRAGMDRHSARALPEATPPTELPAADETPVTFDLALTGRTLIILGGGFLLRAATESGALAVAAGVGLGLLYALAWSLFSLRKAVPRNTAAYYTTATALIALPLIFEATRKFHVFTAWSSAAALAAVAAVLFLVIGRRRLHGTAWVFTLMTVGMVPLLMSETRSPVPFTLLFIGLGVVTLWLGYVLGWELLSWVVAVMLDIVLLVFTVLVVTRRLPDLSPMSAMAVQCLAFAAYLGSFAFRALWGRREAAGIDIAQTFALLVVGLGGAMWIAVSGSASEMPLALAMLALAAISYGVSFTFVARLFATPRNFVFTSSLALMLVVVGGSFMARGLATSIFWSALALSGAYLATHYRKSSLALHAAVYLFCGFVGADVVRLGLRALVLKVDHGWLVPEEGTILLFAACLIATTIRPIERQGAFELWTTAKVMILCELGWIGATLAISAIGLVFLNVIPADPGVVAVVRTAVLAALAVGTAWACRFATLSPARLLVNPLMIALGIKLLWEDVRAGRPATLFISFAIVGAALILTPRLRRKVNLPQAVMVATPT